MTGASAMLAALAAAGWYAVARGTESMADLSRTAEVDAASGRAKAVAERRVEEVVGTLPGDSRRFGAAAADHCVRHVPFEGEPAGPLSCQWRLERYLVFDGDLRTVGEQWLTALGDNDRWIGERMPFAPDFAATSERYEYRDPRTHDRLVVTLVREPDELRLLDDKTRFEAFETYERERQAFTGRKAAERALAEGRRVARVSLVSAYHAQDGRNPLEPVAW
ncbi:hypothetical protein [Streptomyces alkaliterrae]|uniref:Uncharacterized protein n=1 Tax=Streptomyces alkaliterrae TaxID=2213162 RepID=A0A5P0YSQ9_9ACTN|nr:hypothetical protein [Streptomyces alkaliterrae]MBB1260786.1 hypothetical protein [Streptomyces alkaliterrae]MQS02637.1 hypothetical protein [Streptomyces alkaliterrae]